MSTPKHSLVSDGVKVSPLTGTEQAYLKAVSIKDVDSLHHFFEVLMTLERSKWVYALENYLIFPTLTSAETCTKVADAFLSQPSWQAYIFPLFSTDVPLDDEQEEKKLFGDSMSLFTLVHYEHLRTSREKAAHDADTRKKDGSLPKQLSMFGVLCDSLDALDEFAGWSDDTVMLARLMLNSLLTKVINSAATFKHDVLRAEWHNVMDLCHAVESFIFYRPVRGLVEVRGDNTERQCGLHVDSDGLCLDLPLVDRVIELLSKQLKVDHLTDVMDSIDKNVAKYQRKWKERGGEWLECFKTVSDFFHHLEEGKVEDTQSKEFASFLNKRKGHAPTAQIRKALAHALERVMQAKKREGIVGASRIASLLMHNRSGSRGSDTPHSTSSNTGSVKLSRTSTASDDLSGGGSADPAKLSAVFNDPKSPTAAAAAASSPASSTTSLSATPTADASPSPHATPEQSTRALAKPLAERKPSSVSAPSAAAPAAAAAAETDTKSAAPGSSSGGAAPASLKIEITDEEKASRARKVQVTPATTPEQRHSQ